MTGSPGLAQLRGELGLREGVVPAALDDALGGTPVYQISADAFLLSLPMGLAFHYRRGMGTRFWRAPGVSDDAVALFFDGTVFGAIAWLNGFVPLHASAVRHDGAVHAFAGPAGEGKSTLAVALARHGMAAWCDDVLVLDLDDPGGIVALPGPARMKLWGDALTLTGRDAGPAVRPGIAKFYLPDPPAADREPLPVRRLCFLDSDAAAAPGITGIAQAEALERVRTAYYRPHLFAALAGEERYFHTAARLAQAIPLACFNRLRTAETFDGEVDLIAADIHGAG